MNKEEKLTQVCKDMKEILVENKQLKEDLEYVLNQVLGAFENNWCIDWNFSDIRKKYNIEGVKNDEV